MWGKHVLVSLGTLPDWHVRVVQSLMERAVVLGFSANQQEASPALASLVNEYASLLASQVSQCRSPALRHPRCLPRLRRMSCCICRICLLQQLGTAALFIMRSLCPIALTGSQAENQNRCIKRQLPFVPLCMLCQCKSQLRTGMCMYGQGRMKAAMEYLNLIPGEATADVAVLRDRIYRSGAPGVSDVTAAPPFPFIAQDVPVAAAAAAHTGAPAHHAPGDPPSQPTHTRSLTPCMCAAIPSHVHEACHRTLYDSFGCVASWCRHVVGWTLIVCLSACSCSPGCVRLLRAQQVHCGRQLQGRSCAILRRLWAAHAKLQPSAGDSSILPWQHAQSLHC